MQPRVSRDDSLNKNHSQLLNLTTTLAQQYSCQQTVSPSYTVRILPISLSKLRFLCLSPLIQSTRRPIWRHRTKCVKVWPIHDPSNSSFSPARSRGTRPALLFPLDRPSSRRAASRGIRRFPTRRDEPETPFVRPHVENCSLFWLSVELCHRRVRIMAVGCCATER